MKLTKKAAAVFIGLIMTTGTAFSSDLPHFDDGGFLLAVPPAHDPGLLGWFNPAMVNTIHRSETMFLYSADEADFGNFNNWGIFTGVQHLSFSALRSRIPIPDGEGGFRDTGVTDYRITLGTGDRNLGFGIGYGWSRGKAEARNDRVWTAGFLFRPNRVLSLGLSGLINTDYDRGRASADAALRLFGTDRFTVFGGLNFRSEPGDDAWGWQAGAMVQPVDGIFLSGRILDDGRFLAGVGWNLGRAGLTVRPAYAKNGRLTHAVYGLRMGGPRPSVFTRFQKDNAVLSMNLSGRLKYQRMRILDQGPTLRGVLEALNDCLEDNRIAGVALNLTTASPGGEMAWEIREALTKLRARGKRVVAFLERGTMTTYHLASAADVVVLDPEGMLILEGVLRGRTYMAEAIEKTGLGFEEWRFFKYKSAMENYARNSMSEADREQRQALVDDHYELIRDDVCRSRGLTFDEFDRLVDEQALFTGTDALKAGLADTLGRWSNVKEILGSLPGFPSRRLSEGDLSRRAFPERKWGPKPRIALVYALGVCATDMGIKARELERILLRLAEDKSIRAVVMRVDSPGGDALASDLVSEAMKKVRAKKPLIVTQGSVAGSGGYWISMEADTIVAAPHTVTGSIGVIGGWIWNKELGDWLGMRAEYVKRGRHADLGFGIQLPLINLSIPDRNLTEEELALMKRFILGAYETFVRKVAAGRSMTEEEVESIAQGRVWSGTRGKEIGLVDCIGGLERAVELAREAAGIPVDKEVELLEYPKPVWFDPSALIPPLFGVMRPFEIDPAVEYWQCVMRFPGQPLLLMSPIDIPPEWGHWKGVQ